MLRAEPPAGTAPPRPRRAGAGRGRISGLRRSQQRWGWIFAAPAVVGFVVFIAGPMLASFAIGLTDWQIGLSPNFVGLANVREILLEDPVFWRSLQATGYYALLSVPLSVVVAFFMAMLLSRATKGRGLFRTLYYLPVLVPPVASAVLWLWIFSPDAGLLNIFLRLFGVSGVRWLSDESTAVPSLAIMAAWAFGNMALIFLAALQGVPRELLEAGAMDGAGPARRTWHIVLPQVSPIIFFNLVTGLIAAFQSFDAAYVMTSGGPNYATYFYVYMIYQTAFAQGQLGLASALAWILFIIILIVTLLVFRTARHWVFYEVENR